MRQKILLLVILIATGFAANAQRLTIGGYGEAMMTRNFYGDAWPRYNHPEQYKDDKSHGRFDIPHFVINLGYDFGKGWTLGTEIEFEHAERRPWRDRAGWTLGTEIEFERGGTESAVELEADEAGEYESEIERGGEVALEQFWLQKAFSDAFKVRTGMIIIPVGLTNGHHLPTEFFTAYRMEGENTVFPCTWHEPGIEILGNLGKWSYELMFLPGLDSDGFSTENFIQGWGRIPLRKMGESLPPAYRIKAERAYNALPPLFPIAGTFLIIGLVMLAAAMRRMIRGNFSSTRVGKKYVPEIFKIVGVAAAFVFFLVLTIVLGLFWIASGHIPFSNGAETMLTIAWTAMLASVLSFKRFSIMLPFGIIVASLAALVSAMGNANPAVTQLMPVLSSPLLSIHVSLMMLSYTVLAIIMVNGICGLVASLRHTSVSDSASAKMARMSEALMYPALFFLGSGIIAGSIWANVSWGCYWNWDPKETWALITFLIASLGVHRTRLPFLRSHRAYHIYTLILSASVLFTYFGVNYLLGGMHSYA